MDVRSGTKLRSVIAPLVLVMTLSTLGVLAEAAPSVASPLTTVVSISAGVYHTCALLSDASVQCWGRNDGGEIGDGTITSRSAPVAVADDTGTSTLTGVTQVETGSGSCALMTDTTVRCWGDNQYGELGIGNKTGPETCNQAPCSMLPLEVQNADGSGPLTGVVQISVGDGEVCAVMSDTTVMCWGGTSSAITRPKQVVINAAHDPLTGVSSVSVGRGHTCALVNDGTARCWGDNNWGQLGNGTTTPGFVVVKNSAGTGPLTSIAGIAAGYYQTCAALQDQTAVCWGLNGEGETGDGTVAFRLRAPDGRRE